MARHSNCGFTLLEVMVALAIMGVGAVMVIELYSISLRSIKKAEDNSNAALLARSVMEEALADTKLEEGSLEGEAPGGFKFRRMVAETTLLLPQEEVKDDTPGLDESPEEEAREMRLFEITVEVTWSYQGSMEIKGRRIIEKSEEDEE